MKKRFFSLMLSLCIIICEVTILPVVASAGTYTPVAVDCFNGHTYFMYDVSMNWFDAKSFCERLGGHLVTITSVEEQQVVEKLLESGEKKQYWLGLTLAFNSPKWVTGEEYNYSNWDRGEPNECARNDGQHEYYTQIYNVANPAVYGSKRFKWNDMYYDNTFPFEEDNFSLNHIGFICEWDNEKGIFANIIYNGTTYDLLSQSININKESKAEVSVKGNL